MREIGTPKIGSHIASSNIANSDIKRQRITVNKRIGSRKRPFLDSIYTKSQIKRPHITRAACIELDLIVLSYFTKRHLDRCMLLFEVKY